MIQDEKVRSIEITESLYLYGLKEYSQHHSILFNIIESHYFG